MFKHFMGKLKRHVNQTDIKLRTRKTKRVNNIYNFLLFINLLNAI